MARIDELIQRRKHADPAELAREEAPAQSEARRARLATSGMQAFRRAFLADDSNDIREAVVADLRGYFTDAYFAQSGPDEQRAREKAALWSINLLWYAYLQAEGFADPVQAEIADAAKTDAASSRHLDFGSGVGVTSQLFHSLGYTVDLADTENDLLAFARYRLERRSISARYIHLGTQSLPNDSYDAVTAIDTLSFVPDFGSAAHSIRRAMRMGGLLFANFDTRHGVQIGWDILHHDHLWLRRRLQDEGFEPDLKLGGGVRRYRAVESNGIKYLARRARNAVLFPTRAIYWAARSRLSAKGG